MPATPTDTLYVSPVWEGQWQDVIGVAYEQAQQFPQQQDAAATQQPQAEQGDLPAFQFQLRERDQPPVSVTRVVVRTAVGLAVGEMTGKLFNCWDISHLCCHVATQLLHHQSAGLIQFIGWCDCTRVMQCAASC